MNGICCANKTIPSRIYIKECVIYTWKFHDGILDANIQHHNDSLQAKNTQNQDLEKQRFYSMKKKKCNTKMLLFSNSALLMKDVIYNRMFRQLLIERRQEIEERTLASSERGLGLLYESEKVRRKLRKKGEIAFVFLLCN